MNKNVISAIFRRNLVGYFSNPTGYVFICVFVLLSGFAAFWPNEFFNTNLANLDQFNAFLPLIMLVFIPAITMGIWAEERRQGTDELLLTIPAADRDVVLGKYLAAVAIFSISLLFSVWNIVVLKILGNPDIGLMVSTYFGYWLVGVAMLAIGMVASFLTSNLTVGFILGAAFNAPLAFASSVGAIVKNNEIASAVKRWGLGEQFADFGRGVISLSGLVYFAMIVVTGLYLSMILIGRRHWSAGRDGQSLIGHYLTRAVALVLIAAGVSILATRHDLRVDTTVERLNSLSGGTKKLLRGLENERPVRIEAYISPHVPESYASMHLNLVNTLKEIDSLGGSKVELLLYSTEKRSDNAARADDLYSIKGRQVPSRERGAIKLEEIYMGVAVMCGLEKVVVPFFDRGTPVEYELVRSIATVTDQQRKTIGVVKTDAKLFGSFDMQRMRPTSDERLIDELRKQYEVEEVSPDQAITGDFDALVVVQPSSLSDPQLANLMAAIESGMPTAIFEDPFPYIDSSVPGTSAPKRPQGNPMMGNMQPPPTPKGDINRLWNLLGVRFQPTQVVYHNYNPHKQFKHMPPEFVFVGATMPGEIDAFNEGNQITSGLQEVLFLYPGAMTHLNTTELDFAPLVSTSHETGTVAYGEIMSGGSPFGPSLNPNPRRIPSRDSYVLAAHISGKLGNGILEMSDQGLEPADGSEDQDTGDGETAEPTAVAEQDAAITEEASDSGGEEPAAEEPGINVVLVADIDLLYSAFYTLRDRGNDPEAEGNLIFDNVPFVLNVLDDLAGVDDFIDVRKRRPKHRTLERIESWTEGARNKAEEQRDEFIQDFQDRLDEEQGNLDEKIEKIEKQEGLDDLAKRIMMETARRSGQARLQARTTQLENEREREIERIDRDLELSVVELQDWCKIFAVFFPPIPPLCLALGVFLYRRRHESEGVSRKRLR